MTEEQLILYRLAELDKAIAKIRAELDGRVEDVQAALHQLETRLTIAEMEAQGVAALRKVAYWVGGLIIAGSIGFGFSVLTFVPH